MSMFQEPGFIKKIKAAAASVGIVWGDITGDISDQTDLQAALDAKANITDLATVAFTGDYDDLSNKPTIAEALKIHYNNEDLVIPDNIQVTGHGYIELSGTATIELQGTGSLALY